MECPKCGSADFKKLSIIVDEGTYTSVSDSDGVINGSSRGAVGGRVQSSSLTGTVSSTTVTSNISDLAYKLAAPYKASPVITVLKGIGYGFLCVFISELICEYIFDRASDNFQTYLFISFIIGMIPAGFIMKARIKKAIQEHRFNKYEYPLLYSRWEQSFHCNRCGEVFE